MHAVDTDERARHLCLQMAKANGVDSRVLISESCSPDDLVAHAEGRRALVICDCEGYESVLFTERTACSLFLSDAIIEVHEWAAPGVAARVTELFSRSHHCHVIDAFTDQHKIDNWHFAELAGLASGDVEIALAERRPAGMSWLVLESKQES